MRFNKGLQPTAGRYDDRFGLFAVGLAADLIATALEKNSHCAEKKP